MKAKQLILVLGIVGTLCLVAAENPPSLCKELLSLYATASEKNSNLNVRISRSLKHRAEALAEEKKVNLTTLAIGAIKLLHFRIMHETWNEIEDEIDPAEVTLSDILGERSQLASINLNIRVGDLERGLITDIIDVDSRFRRISDVVRAALLNAIYEAREESG